jgi:HEAT repeat protein
MTDPITELCQLIAEQLRDNPELSSAALAAQVEAANPGLVAALKSDGRVQQMNRDGSQGFQTSVQGGVANVGTHYHVEAKKLGELLQAVLHRMQTAEIETVDFQPYLQSLRDDDDYREWQDLYTPTTVEGRTPSPQTRFSRRLKLRVETVKPPKEDAPGQPEPDTRPQLEEPEQREKTEQLDVLDGLRKYAPEHVLLVGKPGSGKSTSLEWLLWNEAHNALANPVATIPVLVRLRRCTSTIEGLIQDFLSRHQLTLSLATIETLLQQGKLLLLLDGLNELPDAFRTEIANFRGRYRKTTPMVVSTRDLSVGGTLEIAKTLKMLPLTERQMQEFVRGYLGEAGNQLFKKLKGDRLGKFAETPLLLWMLCRVFAQNGNVPANLGLAFREFTQLYDQDLQQDAPSEAREQWPKLLRHLAFALMHDRELVDFRLSMPKEEAVDVLTTCLQQEGRTNPREKAELWLNDLLKYHLIQLVMQANLEEHIEFRHQLIQEYYAAEYLLRLLPDLSDEQLKRDYLNYLKWTEPIALMLALVDDEAQALRLVKLAMDEVDLMLGARLAGEVKLALQAITVSQIDALAVPPRLKAQCWATSHAEAAIPGLLQALKHPDFSVRESAVEALGQLGSEATIPGLLQALGDPDSNFRWRAAAALGQLGSEAAIPGLLQALDDQDFDVRWSAVETLGQLGSEAAIPGLLQALDDQDFDVRWSAVETLGQLGSKAAIPGLLQALDDPDFVVRGRAAAALRQLGSEAAIPGLLQALEHSNSNVCRRALLIFGMNSILKFRKNPTLGLCFIPHLSNACRSVAAALEQLGSEAAIPGLLQALEHSNSDVCRRALLIFGMNSILKFRKNPTLGLCFISHLSNACRSVAAALEQLGSEAAILGLLQALKHPDFSVRESVAAASEQLGSDTKSCLVTLDSSGRMLVAPSGVPFGIRGYVIRISYEAAIPGLLQALEHPNSPVRWRAAAALGQLGSEAAIPGLLQALEDPDSSVRERAAAALEQLGSEAAILGLLQALEDPDFSVRERAAAALGQLGSEAAILGLLQALEHPNSNVRGSAAETLGKLGSEAAIPGLLQALEDPDSSVRERAAAALGQLGSEAAILGLLQALEDPDSSVRERAAAALGQLGSEAAILGLLQALDDPNSNVRMTAAEALGKIGSERSAIALEQILQTRGVDLRQIAVEALGKIAAEESLTPLTKAFIIRSLMKALEDKYSVVRQKSIEALERIGNSKPLAELWKRQLHSSHTDIYSAISAIQNRCRFYNYEIWQEVEKTIQNEKLEVQNGEATEKAGAQQNFYGPVYGVAGSVEGNQIIPPPPPNSPQPPINPTE